MTPCENILKRAHTLSTGLPLPRVDECWEEGHHQFESYEVDQLVGNKLWTTKNPEWIQFGLECLIEI
ncbi:hypothetical protein Avbf_17114 [Armadillidium vulgare]|nr:hypothetical protein Avbf_17114 [Armadillidium vulgare]